MPTTTSSDWGLETALDVEWVHSVAPLAKIVLVVTPDNGGSLWDGVQAASSLGSIVSMSWGAGEFGDETSYDETYFSAPNVLYFAATGDDGSGVIYPSASPNVTACGGTTLTINSNFTWASEIGWSGSGGGVSEFEPHAQFQQPWVVSGNREVPDVAAEADPNTGVYVVQAGGWWQVGGTSLATPLWAAFSAVLESNLGTPIGEATFHNDLYNFGSPANIDTYFHDIVSGSNGGYTAVAGYDMVTGIGSPIVNELLPAFSGTVAAAPPVITSASSASGNQGSPFTYQIIATNSPSSYSASGLPAGFSINTVTGVISGVPSSPGTSTVTIGATNASGAGTKTLTITIGAPLPVPVISSSTTVTATVGVPFTYQIAASNSPTSYAATGMPSGLQVNTTTTGQILSIPLSPGVWTTTISASNYSGTGTARLTITVNPAIPQIVGASTASAVVGSPFTYQINALDTPTSFNAVGLPSGLTINTATGVISGTPTSAGSTTAAISATNVTGSTSANLTIEVEQTAPSTITVTNTNDSGSGSLRAAITAANSAPGSTIVFTSGLTGTISLQSALPTILTDMTITGPGATNLTISAGSKYRIFRCGNGTYAGQYPESTGGIGGTVTISGLTLQNGTDAADEQGGGAILITSSANLVLTGCTLQNNETAYVGGAISNGGDAAINNCVFTGNQANAAAIFNLGVLTLAGSSIVGNTAPLTSSAMYNEGVFDGWPANGQVTVTDCQINNNNVSEQDGAGCVYRECGVSTFTGTTFTGNSAPLNSGFLVYNRSLLNRCAIIGNSASVGFSALETLNGMLTVQSSTIANNAGECPAIMVAYGWTNILDSTVTGNTSTTYPGVLWLEGYGNANLTDDILYGNTYGSADFELNLWEAATDAVAVMNTDIYGGYTGQGNLNSNPLLAPLGNYGGPTETMALLP